LSFDAIDSGARDIADVTARSVRNGDRRDSVVAALRMIDLAPGNGGTT
jgi:hypothetical protein